MPKKTPTLPTCETAEKLRQKTREEMLAFRALAHSLLETVSPEGELSRFSEYSLLELRQRAADLLYRA